jgi:mannose-6-phosphate isomerase class I
MGAHADLPCEAELDDLRIPLDRLLEQAGEQILGSEVVLQFGRRLPYLFKVLAAAAPLSIQVHPSQASAREGFARENAAGIPLSAAERNYKEGNHKPELLAALTDFYALRGFRPLAEIADLLQAIPELQQLSAGFRPTHAGLETCTLMHAPAGGRRGVRPKSTAARCRRPQSVDRAHPTTGCPRREFSARPP